MLVGVAAVVTGAVAVSVSAQAGGTGDGLFGRPFLSGDAVVKNGERFELVEGTRLRLDFDRDGGRDVVGWRAGCNYFGGDVTVTEERLEISGIAGTEIGCEKPLLRQDRWIARFLGAHPEWSRTRGRLKLIRNDDVVRLWRR
jgi:heat shock protein HslJ